jgi:hypothetical protein
MNRQQRLKHFAQTAEYVAQLLKGNDESDNDDKIDEARAFMQELQSEMDAEELDIAADAVQSINLRRVNRLN